MNRTDDFKQGARDRGLRFMASLGVGLLPGPQGTYASLATCAAALAWLAAGGAPLAGPWYAALVLAMSAASVAVAQAAVKRRVFGQSEDPGQIVIDESAGQLLALYGVAHPGWEMLAALAAFRFFDIAKPWPVNASQRLPGGWGVTADDFLAGLYALALVRLLASWLG